MHDDIDRDHRLDDDEGVRIPWRYLTSVFLAHRRLIAALVLAVAGVAALAGLVAYLDAPVQRTARVGFRLLFAGADRGEYPNGTAFSVADIIATPVLMEVHAANDLERWLPFQRMRDGLAVLEVNHRLDMLHYEFQARLADGRLPPVERARLEREYEQRRAALRTSQLSLEFTPPASAAPLPNATMEKLLHDILRTWADQVAERKGVLAYQVGLITPNGLLRDLAASQTPLVRFDQLRRHVGRVVAQIDRLLALPGASTIRLGEERVTLADIRARLNDLLEFSVKPGIRRRLLQVSTAGRGSLNEIYLENRLTELERLVTTADTRKKELQSALQGFMASAPVTLDAATVRQPQDVTAQIGESALDQIVAMATRAAATDYRRELTDRIIAAAERSLSLQDDAAFYRESVALLRGSGSAGRLPPTDVEAEIDELQNRLLGMLALVNEAYEMLSATNLNPSGEMFRIAAPYSVRTVRSAMAGRILSGVLVAFAASLVLVPLAVVGFVAGRDFVRGMPGGAARPAERIARDAGSPAGTGSANPPPQQVSATQVAGGGEREGAPFSVRGLPPSLEG
jgi:hypothetical protein